VIEYVFDGSRFRVQITDPEMASTGLQFANFTLIVGGVASPRVGSSRSDPPTESEPFADEAKAFVETRLLHRELKISLHGTDKSGICAVGTIHHPRGNIGVELLKNGLARVSDWSARMMNPLDIPAFRVAENNAKVSIILDM
jgi:staphylococcal nuclease domain-containing protein 1